MVNVPSDTVKVLPATYPLPRFAVVAVVANASTAVTSNVAAEKKVPPLTVSTSLTLYPVPPAAIAPPVTLVFMTPFRPKVPATVGKDQKPAVWL